MAWLFITPPTCATGSYMRVMRSALQDQDSVKNVSDDFWASGNIKGMENFAPEPAGRHVFVWNTLQHWNKAIDTRQYAGVLVNFRDPRDLLCNQFHWALQHEQPGASEEQLKQRRDEIQSAGIDAFVVEGWNVQYNKRVFSVLREIVERHGPEKLLPTTYAQICLGFDDMLKRLCEFFEVPLTDKVLEECALERPEQINRNEKWWKMTGKYAGHDFAPGRYKAELKPETIDRLTEIYLDELAFCRKWDVEEFKHLY